MTAIEPYRQPARHVVIHHIHHVRHEVHHHDGAAHKARLQAWLARNGFENLTEAVDNMIGE